MVSSQTWRDIKSEVDKHLDSVERLLRLGVGDIRGAEKYKTALDEYRAGRPTLAIALLQKKHNLYLRKINTNFHSTSTWVTIEREVFLSKQHEVASWLPALKTYEKLAWAVNFLTAQAYSFVWPSNDPSQSAIYHRATDELILENRRDLAITLLQAEYNLWLTRPILGRHETFAHWIAILREATE